MAKKKKVEPIESITDKIIKWVGTTNSLIVHTCIFVITFLSPYIFHISFDIVLLVLTTIVSLEAIYLAIFIQLSVNRQAVRLDDVEDSLDDVEESLDDVGESLDDVEEGLDDVEESLSSTRHHVTKSTNQKKLELSLEEIIEELKLLKTQIDNKK